MASRRLVATERIIRAAAEAAGRMASTGDEGLPYSRPPAWMRIAVFAALGAAVLGVLGVLLGPMDERVAAPGVVRPRDYALVFPPPAGGVIAEVMAMPGQAVKSGDLLATLDAEALMRERTAAVHELARADAGLADAEAKAVASEAAPISPDIALQAASAERLGTMVDERRKLVERMEAGGEGHAISLVELVRERLALQSLELERDRARSAAALASGPYGLAQRGIAQAQVAAARSARDGLKARVDLLTDELARREIRAPVDGVLVSRSVRFTGERAQVGQALFKIASGNQVRLRLYAGEDRVGRIKSGMKVIFRPKSDPDRLSPLRTGLVTAVATDRDLAADEADRPAAGSYAIDVDIDGRADDLPFGSTVDAEIILAKRPFWQVLMRKR